MSSPFSEQMRQTLDRLNTSLTPSSSQESGPVITAASVDKSTTPSVSKSLVDFKNINLQTFKNPMVAFPTGVVLFYLLILAFRSKIWKDEKKRPRATRLFLYIILLAVPPFFWIFMRRK